MIGKRYEMALSFSAQTYQKGPRSFEFDESDVEALEIGPLIYEERALSDHWDNDAYQLDVRVNGEKYSSKQRSRAYLDVDMNQVVLNGTSLESGYVD